MWVPRARGVCAIKGGGTGLLSFYYKIGGVSIHEMTSTYEVKSDRESETGPEERNERSRDKSGSGPPWKSRNSIVERPAINYSQTRSPLSFTLADIPPLCFDLVLNCSAIFSVSCSLLCFARAACCAASFAALAALTTSFLLAFFLEFFDWDSDPEADFGAATVIEAALA